MKKTRWRLIGERARDAESSFVLMMDLSRFPDYVERARHNKNHVAKFGPMQIRLRPGEKN